MIFPARTMLLSDAGVLAQSEGEALAAIERSTLGEIESHTGRASWIHWACIKDYGLAAQALIDKGVDPQSRNHDGHTPLMLAALNGSGSAALAVGAGASPQQLYDAQVAGRLYASLDPMDLHLQDRRKGFELAILFIQASREAEQIAQSAAPAAPALGRVKSL